jgi:hypothetical protein
MISRILDLGEEVEWRLALMLISRRRGTACGRRYQVIAAAAIEFRSAAHVGI